MNEIHDENGVAYPGTGFEDCDVAILATENREAICIECYMDKLEPDRCRNNPSSTLL